MFKEFLRFLVYLTISILAFTELQNTADNLNSIKSQVRGRRSPVPAAAVKPKAFVTSQQTSSVPSIGVSPYTKYTFNDNENIEEPFNLITYISQLSASLTSGDQKVANKKVETSSTDNSNDGNSNSSGVSERTVFGLVIGGVLVAVFASAVVAYVMRPKGVITLD